MLVLLLSDQLGNGVSLREVIQAYSTTTIDLTALDVHLYQFRELVDH